MSLKNYPIEAYFTKMMYKLTFAKKLALCKVSDQELLTSLKLWWKQSNINSHRRCSVKKGILRNFAKFTGKHLCQTPESLFLIRLEACNFIKKEALARVFSWEFCKISKNTFSTENLRTTASETTVPTSSLMHVPEKNEIQIYDFQKLLAGFECTWPPYGTKLVRLPMD